MTSLHFSLIFISLLFSTASAEFNKNCVYTLYIKTGSIMKGGTDSKISLDLSDHNGRSVSVLDLKSWGLMGKNHNYFERGNLDVFSGRGPCINAPACKLNLTSDGTGEYHGWYCDYVELTLAAPHVPSANSLFYVDRWLATNSPPFKLSAVINGCGHSHAHIGGHTTCDPLVVTDHVVDERFRNEIFGIS